MARCLPRLVGATLGLYSLGFRCKGTISARRGSDKKIVLNCAFWPQLSTIQKLTDIKKNYVSFPPILHP